MVCFLVVFNLSSCIVLSLLSVLHNFIVNFMGCAHRHIVI